MSLWPGCPDIVAASGTRYAADYERHATQWTSRCDTWRPLALPDHELKPPAGRYALESEVCGGQRTPLRSRLRPPSVSPTDFATDGGRSMHSATPWSLPARTQ